MADRTDIARSIMVTLFTLAVLVQLLNPAISVSIAQSRTPYDDTVPLGSDGQGRLDEGFGVVNVRAHQTLNNTVAFDGTSDSRLTGTAEIDRDATWTVSHWVRLDSAVDTQNATQRTLQLGGWLYLDYNQTDWRAIYYDSDTLNSYVASVPAPTPATWTRITVQRNSTHLFVTTNATGTNATVRLTDGNSISTNLTASTLHGRVEETRVFDDVLNASERQQLTSKPTAPLEANETARIYYDTYPGEQSVDVFRTGSDLAFGRGVRVVGGFVGQGARRGQDYTRSGGVIRTVSGGTLDGAAAVFVEYQAVGVFGVVLQRLVALGRVALTLIVLGVLVKAASFVSRETGF